ncbi:MULTISPECIES: phage major capsid protein [Bacillus]|uniref:phage major capsid protein n=1 Tax=Bacillus TaxID=1386 RepID=UPI00077B1BD4|nr:phage major capsid protein [Bacillus cereus]MCO4220263.1 phage major capsid protein [Bacillus sp. 10017]KXY15214.1 phage capsid protein [Bacillus cereus]MCB5900277.1 phage major capsid protein [Bacillus cereus]MCO4220311.1 phage major capsid protein [Bacillus sp. 10017]MCU4733433.1 phage major capsid protein [Bacillus cereus]
MKTIYELKQAMATIGQQLAKTENELATKAMDPSASLNDIKVLQASKADLQARFDVVKQQHDQLEAEQTAKFAQQKNVITGIEDPKQKEVAAKAEFIRAAVQGRAVSDDVKALIALPAGNSTGGDKFFPTNMQKELVHEPFAKNQLREVSQVSAIKGLELPKISYTLDDDDFITDEETAKEMKLTGDTVAFGRNKFKVKVKISDTVIHGTDVELTQYVENALRSGLAAKEKKDALAVTPKSGLGHMSFYNGSDVKRVSGEDLFESITNAIADLHEDYRENAKVVMRYADYLKIVKSLSNGTTNFFDTPPEKVMGKPVEFVDAAVKPIVGDFNFFRINYDAMTYDTDKNVDSGEYLFVLTAWYDQKRSLNSAFRIAEVKVTP